MSVHASTAGVGRFGQNFLKRARRSAGLMLAVLPLAGLLVSDNGCVEQPKKQTPAYALLPGRDVPAYMQGTIYQYADLTGLEPAPVSGYGLVAHLHGTGGSRVPTPVRAYMVKMLAQHDFGSLATGWATPDQILNSKDVAVVKVEGFLPPGGRAGTDWSNWFDLHVTALPESNVTSLAHGVLFQCELKTNGANPAEPGNGDPRVKAMAGGEVFVNPAYALDTDGIDTPGARRSRREGTVLHGGKVMQDQPLVLRLRAPERQMARSIEQTIIEHFQDCVDADLHPDTGSDAASAKKIANAMDEAQILCYVPRVYSDDWEHFAGVMHHLYLDGADPGFAAKRAKELADAAVNDPKAYLLDISYCLEGLGKPALYAIAPMLTSPRPDVRYAGARAAAFIGDPAAVPVLLQIAQTPGDPYRLNAVQVLGNLPPTPMVDRMCRVLLDSDQALVREQAYQMLARHGDNSVLTHWVTNGDHQLFALDVIDRNIIPTVYGTRQGVPRIAVFGNNLSLQTPLMFTAMDRKLSISTDADGKLVNIYYRGQDKPVSAQCAPRVTDLICALTGDNEPAGPGSLHLDYSEALAVVQTLIDQQRITGTFADRQIAASFTLQDLGETEEVVNERPLVKPANGARPNSDNSKPTDVPAADHPVVSNPLEHASTR